MLAPGPVAGASYPLGLSPSDYQASIGSDPKGIQSGDNGIGAAGTPVQQAPSAEPGITGDSTWNMHGLSSALSGLDLGQPREQGESQGVDSSSLLNQYVKEQLAFLDRDVDRLQQCMQNIQGDTNQNFAFDAQMSATRQLTSGGYLGNGANVRGMDTMGGLSQAFQQSSPPRTGETTLNGSHSQTSLASSLNEYARSLSVSDGVQNGGGTPGGSFAGTATTGMGMGVGVGNNNTNTALPPPASVNVSPLVPLGMGGLHSFGGTMPGTSPPNLYGSLGGSSTSSAGSGRRGPSGPRQPGQGTEDLDQDILSIERAPNGTVKIRITLLAAGFVIGQSGTSVRAISQHTGANIQSWTVNNFSERSSRVFQLQGTPKSCAAAEMIIREAVERYKTLCEGKSRGEYVQRVQRVHGVEFSYQPPPRSAAPMAAALGGGRGGVVVGQAQQQQGQGQQQQVLQGQQKQQQQQQVPPLSPHPPSSLNSSLNQGMVNAAQQHYAAQMGVMSPGHVNMNQAQMMSYAQLAQNLGGDFGDNLQTLGGQGGAGLTRGGGRRRGGRRVRARQEAAAEQARLARASQQNFQRPGSYQAALRSPTSQGGDSFLAQQLQQHNNTSSSTMPSLRETAPLDELKYLDQGRPPRQRTASQPEGSPSPVKRIPWQQQMLLQQQQQQQRLHNSAAQAGHNPWSVAMMENRNNRSSSPSPSPSRGFSQDQLRSSFDVVDNQQNNNGFSPQQQPRKDPWATPSYGVSRSGSF